jgi:ATP-dependent helicase/nuclease subunit A
MNTEDQTLQKTVDTGKSVHLSASAGSGKTRALKERYLALLDVLDRRGLNIDQAVAITFTDKAAAEIKERVMHDLPETMLKKVIRGRQDLRISTIHSFCMNLLKRYPLEAGLPPDFGVLDARDQAYKVQKSIEDAFEQFDRDPRVMAPLQDFTVDELLATIEFLISIRSKLKRLEIDAGGAEGLRRSVSRGMGIEQAEADLTALIARPDWLNSFHQMERTLRSQAGLYDENRGHAHLLLAEAKDGDAAFRIAATLAPLYFTAGGEPRKKPFISQKAFSGTLREEYEKSFFNVQEILGTLMTLYSRVRAGREAASLLHLYQGAEENYQGAKLREGLLDFDDLEIHAYRLLQGQESPDILYWLDRKILHFLVDEFQDTSDIQWAIVSKLTEEIFAGQGADKPMRPTLFVVGDEKQSIYRFREANYRLIEDVRSKMEKNIPAGSREILTLDKNFRSTPEVVDTVNKVFGALWGEAFKPSEAERKGRQGSVRLLEVLPGTPDTSGPTEAEVLAREIQSICGQGTAVHERSEDGWKTRPAVYGDCAILIQSRTRLKDYEAALQSAGIPFRVVGGIGFYEEDEIQALINILFVLWNRDDKLALATVLKSPLFGFTDKDLLDLQQDGGNMVDFLKDFRPDDWKLLHGWMNRAGLVPLSSLLHQIVGESGAYVRFGRRNPQAIFNIDKLLDTAREFDRRGYTTLQDFVEWVRNIRTAEQREATADMNLPGFQGAVSIMTVHKAKGLEYPVVFLPGMGQTQRSVTHGPDVIIGEADRGVRMARKDASNPLYAEMWEREKEELRREHQRLLYVAMTRARDHLVMIGTSKDDKMPAKPNTWLDYLSTAAPKPLFDAEIDLPSGVRLRSYPDTAKELSAHKDPQAPFKKDGHSNTEQGSTKKLDAQRIIDNLSALPASESPEWKRATDFIEQGKETALELLSIQTAPNVVSPLTRGSVLHRCLEAYTKQGSYNVEQIIAEYPDILALEQIIVQRFIDDAGTVLNNVLANKDFAWIFGRGDASFSELPFLYKKGNMLVSGIIDRVVIKGNTAQVIDYKAILIENEESLKAWNDHYRPQLQIYCEAIKEIFNLPSVEGYLLFLDSNRLELSAAV